MAALKRVQMQRLAATAERPLTPDAPGLGRPALSHLRSGFCADGRPPASKFPRACHAKFFKLQQFACTAVAPPGLSGCTGAAVPGSVPT